MCNVSLVPWLVLTNKEQLLVYIYYSCNVQYYTLFMQIYACTNLFNLSCKSYINSKM